MPLRERFTASSWLSDQAQPIFRFQRLRRRLKLPSRTRYCRVCGLTFRHRRFDAVVCSDTCRKRLSRDGDLGYLTSLPADQARARRAIHDADDSAIFVAKLAAAARREGRAQRRGLPRVPRMKSAIERDREPFLGH